MSGRHYSLIMVAIDKDDFSIKYQINYVEKYLKNFKYDLYKVHLESGYKYNEV